MAAGGGRKDVFQGGDAVAEGLALNFDFGIVGDFGFCICSRGLACVLEILVVFDSVIRHVFVLDAGK